MNHLDCTTHIKFDEDKPYLTTKLFNVNIRLLQTCPPYREIVRECSDYISWRSATELEGYKKPHGMSGANVGIPWNIIAYNCNGATYTMINPIITRSYGKRIKSQSNCGSLILEEPIIIERWEFIDVEYYDLGGNKHRIEKMSREDGCLTVAHEIEHNLGILITDRKP